MNSTAYINKILEKDKSLNLYQNYAQLFSPYFDLDSEIISQISKAGHKLFCVFLKFDDVIDEQNIKQIPNATLLLSSAILDLQKLIPEDRHFWTVFREKIKNWNNSFDFKKSSRNAKLSYTQYREEVLLKSNFGVLAIHALQELDSNSKYSGELISSHAHYVVAMQLYDDCNDFKLDFVKGHMNYAISYYVKIKGPITDINWAVKDFYISGIANHVLRYASLELNKSRGAKLKSSGSKWLIEIGKLQSKIINLEQFINNYLGLLNEKMSHKNSFKPKLYTSLHANLHVQKLWSFLVSQCNSSTNDLPHFMVLTKAEGFQGVSEIKKGEIFQRAVFIEMICDSLQFNLVDIQKQFRHEIEQIWSLRNRTKVGGWSYLYDVNEIAPDMDDLAQVIIVFHKTSFIHDYREYFTSILDFVFANCMKDNGGLSTWIIPKNSKKNIHKKQKRFNSIYWGDGPHLEVVANFAYAVFLFDCKQYRVQLELMSAYILNQKAENKLYKSRWYCGQYYGTYQVYRFLKVNGYLTKKDVKELIEVLAYYQNDDGGFSENNRSPSNAIQTALVLKIIGLFNLGDSIISMKAYEYLRNSQGEDGAYDACHFIKPRNGQFYKSKLLSSAFVFSVLK